MKRITYQQVLDLKKKDIRTIQVTKRGLATPYQEIYIFLIKNGIRFGEHVFADDGRILGSSIYSDKSVRREGFSFNKFFFYYEGDKKVYLPSERDLWDEVASELLCEKRRSTIADIIR